MILADTSVWIDHFRSAEKELQRGLQQSQIVMHPWVSAELALGSLRDRRKTLSLLDSLPQLPLARVEELRIMIEARKLYSLGIGLTDIQLIASTLMNPPTLLWTRDVSLRQIAVKLGVGASLI